MQHLEDKNQSRSGRYGKRIGDVIKVTPCGEVPYLSEVVGYYPVDNNRLYIKGQDGTIIDWIADWCEVETKVEERTEFNLMKLENEITSAFQSLVSKPDWAKNTDLIDRDSLAKESVEKYHRDKLSIAEMFFWLNYCKVKVW